MFGCYKGLSGDMLILGRIKGCLFVKECKYDGFPLDGCIVGDSISDSKNA